MSIVVIKKFDKFSGPLNSLKSSINSIILSKEDNSFQVNTESEDGSQKVNIHYNSDVIEIKEDDGDIDKLGFYNLSEFLGVLNLCDTSKEIQLKISGNKLHIDLDKKSKISYILSDIDVIEEGPAEPKNPIDFKVDFEISENFIKKIKEISKSLNANVLKFIVKNGKLIYKLTDRTEQSHNLLEVLSNKCDSEDFSIPVSLKDDNRDNIGILTDGMKYVVSLHPRIIQLEGVTEDYEKIRYFLAALDKNKK